MRAMLIALVVALGAGGCAKATRASGQVLAQSSGGGNKGGPPSTLGPAGTAEIPPSTRTRPQAGHGTGGAGPSGAGGERKAPEDGAGGSPGTHEKKK